MAEATIDSLKLEIESSSDGASKGLDALTRSLKKLQTATSKGLGLGSVITEIKQANSSVKSSSLDGLNKAIETLTKLGSVKVSSTIGKQITAISTSLNNADFSAGQAKINELVTALEPLKTLGKTNLTSTLNSLKKLPEVLNGLDTRTLYTKIQSLTRIFKPLADEMQKVANGFSVFPTKIQKLITGTDKLTASNNKASISYINLYAKIKMAWTAVKGVAKKIASWIKLSSDYTETMNLFTVSMGQYAEEAYKDAQIIGNAMGIDPAEWMKHQGVFMTLTKGFGVVGDRANTMSQQLTQLGYDLSSFFNISVEDAMTKLESGIAGELEPLRRLGYDLSQAKLEATALSLGIDKAVSSMTQAEKAELRYYAIMTQVTDAHGDMARTLNAPANQMRILNAQVTQLGRALGNFFIPLLNKVLPYIIASVKVLREVLDVFMDLLGIELADVDFGKGSITSATDEVVSNLEDAQQEAKKLKSYMLGFDELNVINTDDGSDSLGDLSGAGFNFELPTYDFMEGIVATQVDEIVGKMKEWLGLTEPISSWADVLDTKFGEILTTVGAIATGLAAWKITKAFLTALKTIKTITGKKILWGNLLSGTALFLQDLTTMEEYLDDFAENGATFETVTGILSTFAGMVGDVMITLGKTEIGGALKTVEGIGQIVSAVSEMSKSGVNADGVLDVCNGLSNVVIGIGALTKTWKLMGVGMTLQGLVTIIDEVSENWEAIKSGDWSGVDKATLAIAAIEMIGGVVTALGVFNKTKQAVDTAKAAKDIADVGNTVTTVSTTTSTLTGKLTNLVKNLGLGIAVIAEVAVAAGIIIGAIWGLGELLKQVGDAWQPVIDNAGTVAIAVGIGTGLLVTVGVATAALGSVGTPLIVNLALGTAMLALTGADAALFLAEVLAIGALLNEIGKAWQPVIDNANTVAIAVGVGTGVLVVVGAASAALGSVGTGLIVNIALGTAMLALIGADAALFLAEILVVGTLLDKIGKAWQPVLDNGETIAKAIGLGTAILLGIGVVCAALGALTMATGGTVALAMAAGTGMLALLGVEAVLFLAEVKVIGESLTEIGKKWQPVLDNGDAIAKGIKTGSGLLVGIGVATAALGAITVASVGTLPVAIAIGTGLLVELAAAFGKFCDSLSDVSTDITRTLAPALSNMNDVLPDASSDMADFTSFMGTFAWETVRFSTNSSISGIAATVSKIVDFFTTDPIKRISDSAKKQYDQAKALYDNLILAVPKIKAATDELKKYNDAMAAFEKTAGIGSDKHGISGYVLDFVVNVKNTASTWWSNVKNWWNGQVGSVSNFNTNVTDGSSTWWSNVKTWWNQDSRSGVDVKVNALKGWTGTIASVLGIPTSFSLGFNLPRIRVKWSEKEVLGFKITFPSGFETYAQGGFPDVGQMFIAREAGPELVGNIGGRTAVVNNDQIVESVSAGVYQAVLAALGGSSDEGGETNIVINLDGEKIYENQQKIARGRGYNLGMGAFSFG